MTFLPWLIFCFQQTGHSKYGGLRHVLQEGEAGDRWRVPSLRRVRGQTPCVVHRLPHCHLGGLGVGMVALGEEKDMEKVYFPMNSRAMKDRQYVRDTFPDLSNVSYNAFSLSDTDKAVVLLFKSKSG